MVKNQQDEKERTRPHWLGLQAIDEPGNLNYVGLTQNCTKLMIDHYSLYFSFGSIRDPVCVRRVLLSFSFSFSIFSLPNIFLKSFQGRNFEVLYSSIEQAVLLLQDPYYCTQDPSFLETLFTRVSLLHFCLRFAGSCPGEVWNKGIVQTEHPPVSLLPWSICECYSAKTTQPISQYKNFREASSFVHSFLLILIWVVVSPTSFLCFFIQYAFVPFAYSSIP